MTGKFKMANDERGWREAAVKEAQAAKLQSRSGGTSLQRNIKPEGFRGGSAYANGTCALPPGAAGDDLEAVSNDFQSIPITFEKMMNPVDLRYAIYDLSTDIAGDGWRPFGELMRAKQFQARSWVTNKLPVEAAAWVAGESGVAAPALPPQSKTRWLQSPPRDGFGRRFLLTEGCRP